MSSSNETMKLAAVVGATAGGMYLVWNLLNDATKSVLPGEGSRSSTLRLNSLEIDHRGLVSKVCFFLRHHVHVLAFHPNQHLCSCLPYDGQQH
jgi:hypothetical protein